MSDPLGLIGSMTPARSVTPPRTVDPQAAVNGPAFKDELKAQIEAVNQLQTDAHEAVEDFAAGRRDDVEGVIIATQKADAAFRMLLQVRNKMMDAYEEIKQVRV